MNEIKLLESLSFLKKEYDNLKALVSEFADKHKNYSELLNEQLEVNTDSLKVRADILKEKFCDKIKDNDANLSLKVAENTNQIEVILELVRKYVEDNENYDEAKRMIFKCKELIVDTREQLKLSKRLKFEDGSIMLDENVFGNLVTYDEQDQITDTKSYHISFEENEQTYDSVCNTCFIDENKILILGYKSSVELSLEISSYDFIGKLNEVKKININGQVLSSVMVDKFCYIITLCIESGTNDRFYYLTKLSHSLVVLNHVSLNIVYSHELLFIMPTVGKKVFIYECESRRTCPIIHIFDDNLKLIKYICNQNVIQPVSKSNFITASENHIITLHKSELKFYLIDGLTLYKSIPVSQNGLIVLREKFFLCYDNLVFKNVLLKKEYESCKVLKRYAVNLVGSKQVTDLSIDHTDQYALIWCGNTDLLVIKL